MSSLFQTVWRCSESLTEKDVHMWTYSFSKCSSTGEDHVTQNRCCGPSHVTAVSVCLQSEMKSFAETCPQLGGLFPLLFPHAPFPIFPSHTVLLWTLALLTSVLITFIYCSWSLFMPHSFTEVELLCGWHFRRCTTFCCQVTLSCFASTFSEKVDRFWVLFLLRFPLELG